MTWHYPIGLAEDGTLPTGGVWARLEPGLLRDSSSKFQSRIEKINNIFFANDQKKKLAIIFVAFKD